MTDNNSKREIVVPQGLKDFSGRTCIEGYYHDGVIIVKFLKSSNPNLLLSKLAQKFSAGTYGLVDNKVAAYMRADRFKDIFGSITPSI